MAVKDYLNDPVFIALNNFQWATSLSKVQKQGECIIGEWDWTKKAATTVQAIHRATSIDDVQGIVYRTYLSGARMKL